MITRKSNCEEDSGTYLLQLQHLMVSKRKKEHISIIHNVPLLQNIPILHKIPINIEYFIDNTVMSKISHCDVCKNILMNKKEVIECLKEINTIANYFVNNLSEIPNIARNIKEYIIEFGNNNIMRCPNNHFQDYVIKDYLFNKILCKKC